MKKHFTAFAPMIIAVAALFYAVMARKAEGEAEAALAACQTVELPVEEAPADPVEKDSASVVVEGDTIS